jgi:2-aminoadipate transaminase
MLPHPAEDSSRPLIALKLGLPDPSTLDTPELRSAVAAALTAPEFSTGLQYAPDAGTKGLVEFLVEKVAHEQGISVGPANLMLVAGSTHAVDMLARLYAKPNSIVLVEAPTYSDALHVFRDHHIELHAIPMDDDGLIVSALEERIARLEAKGKSPTLLYTIPTFHNPRGSTLGEGRRHAILDVARQHRFMIVEDDVYRDLSFRGPVPASFYSLAHGQQVCSIGSFSKTLAPGFRLGWIVASEEIIQTCMACGTTQMGGGASPFSAQVVAQYCQSGAWESHILQLRSTYETRRDRMLAALARDMPLGVEWTHPDGGFFIWLTLPPNVRAHDVQRLALNAGVSVTTGEAFFLNPTDGTHHIRLAYSYAALEALDVAVHTLADTITRVPTGKS